MTTMSEGHRFMFHKCSCTASSALSVFLSSVYSQYRQHLRRHYCGGCTTVCECYRCMFHKPTCAMEEENVNVFHRTVLYQSQANASTHDVKLPLAPSNSSCRNLSVVALLADRLVSHSILCNKTAQISEKDSIGLTLFSSVPR